ncbi:MAG: hypothetical protein HY985_00425 [Magnetospirillum sp.]|nr:hypothetical protein [Magnetospirillum sp.]
MENTQSLDGCNSRELQNVTKGTEGNITAMTGVNRTVTLGVFIGVVDFQDGLGDFHGTKFIAFKGRVADHSTWSSTHTHGRGYGTAEYGMEMKIDSVVKEKREFFLKDGDQEQAHRFTDVDFRVRSGSIVSVVAVQPPGGSPQYFFAKNHDTGERVFLSKCPIQGIAGMGSKFMTISGLLLQLAWCSASTESSRIVGKGGIDWGAAPTEPNVGAILLALLGLGLIIGGVKGIARASKHNANLDAEFQKHLTKMEGYLDRLPLAQAAAV